MQHALLLLPQLLGLSDMFTNDVVLYNTCRGCSPRLDTFNSQSDNYELTPFQVLDFRPGKD